MDISYADVLFRMGGFSKPKKDKIEQEKLEKQKAEKEIVAKASVEKESWISKDLVWIGSHN